MRLRSIISLSALSGVTFLSPEAGATIIDFNNWTVVQYATQTVFYDSGYTILYTPVDLNGPGVFPSGSAEVGEPPFNIACGPTPCSTDGTNAFYSFNTGSLTISATNGQPFAISALDAAQTFTEMNWTLDFTVTGQTGPTTAVVQDFQTAPGGADSIQTFDITAAGFDNVTSVTIAGVGGYPTDEFAVDNIVVSQVPVPEPPTSAMILLGVAGIGFARRGRARNILLFRQHKSCSRAL
jgi:hypothetical protein